MPIDENVLNLDVVIAAYRLAERSGGKTCEIGYLHDDVPSEQAGWYGVVEFRGAKIMVGDQSSPSAAALALAARLLAGAICRCGKPVTTIDGKQGACRWHLNGKEWKPGCDVAPLPIKGERGDHAAMQAALLKRQRKMRQRRPGDEP